MHSYPFLADRHSDTKSFASADSSILITREGNMVHNLHKDIFYMPDPTLSFVGVPYFTATFTFLSFRRSSSPRSWPEGLRFRPKLSCAWNARKR